LGSTYDAVILSGGGGVTNAAGGVISGSNGVYLRGVAGAVVNAGSINAATGDGVALGAGGSVSNNAGGDISGHAVGVAVYGASGTVTNAGTISGSGYAVKFSNGGTDRLVVDPGGTFVGGAAGGSGSNTLELAAGGAGTIGGIGSFLFSNFGTVAVDSGASWSMIGANSVASAQVDGSLVVNGSLAVTAVIDAASSGTILLDSSATIDVAAALGTNVQISFSAASGLIIGAAGSFGVNVGTASYAGPLLDNFGTGASVDILDIGATGAALSFNSATGVLQITNGAGQDASLDFQTSSLGSGSFHAASDGGSGTLLTHS